jgi:hypothetical protein
LLSRFQSEAGSAVSDFVLLVVPASLLVFPLIELFGLYQAAIVYEQISYDIARYAALADVSNAEATAYRQSRNPDSQLVVENSATGCSFLSKTELSQRITFWPDQIKVLIQGRAECEN